MTDLLGSSVDTAPITLSALEFDVLWEHLRLGEPPVVLRVPSPGRTFAERRELTARVWQALEERGLGRRLSVDERLARLLWLLAEPDQEVDGRLGATRGLRVLVAARGEQAVFAMLSKRGLMLADAPVTGLAREALGWLPPVAAGQGESITVRSAVLDDAARAATAEDFELALCKLGMRVRDAGILRAMLTGVRRQGQFGAAARDQWGHRTRAPHVVGFFDTDAGRYLQLRVANEDGELWSTVSPADRRLLVRQVDDLLAAVRGGRVSRPPTDP